MKTSLILVSLVFVLLTSGCKDFIEGDTRNRLRAGQWETSCLRFGDVSRAKVGDFTLEPITAYFPQSFEEMRRYENGTEEIVQTAYYGASCDPNEKYLELRSTGSYRILNGTPSGYIEIDTFVDAISVIPYSDDASAT